MILDEARVQELIDQGETLDVEFKGESSGQLSDSALVEAVVCLANRQSQQMGLLLLGVEDNGSITGSKPRHGGRTDPFRIQALIANRTVPSLSCRVETVQVNLDQNRREILVVEVPPSFHPVGTKGSKYLRRTIGGKGEPECIPYHFHEMQSRIASRGEQDYTSLPLQGAAWSDLDPLEFERFRQFIQTSHGRGDRLLLELSDRDLAKAIGAIGMQNETPVIRVLALLLFGKEAALSRLLPTHEAAFQVVTSKGITVNEFLRLPILHLIQEFEARFNARNTEEELQAGLIRIGVPDYPFAAFREGLANALVHRDYASLGAVHVQWREEELEISNPGGFPEGVHLTNILTVAPRPRNPLLADALKRAGLVERTARGVDTIFREQLINGRPAPSYDRSTPSMVTLLLPGGRANLAFIRLVVEENRNGPLLSAEGLLILNSLWRDRSLTTPELAFVTQRPDTETRILLNRLIERGLVEARGEGRARNYHLTASTYRRLGKSAEYVRQHGFEPIQLEQMVLQYVEKNKRITRSETSDLCRIGPYQATRLLRKLVDAEMLEMHGSRKGAYYVKRTKI